MNRRSFLRALAVVPLVPLAAKVAATQPDITYPPRLVSHAPSVFAGSYRYDFSKELAFQVDELTRDMNSRTLFGPIKSIKSIKHEWIED